MRTYNAPVGELYKNKSKEPVDHIWRGLTAGCSTAAFDEDMDWVEINCLTTGKPYCEFLFKPRKSFTKEEKKQYKNQLH
ncbi:MAG: V4R domain-containing protein [archaeon]